MAAAVAAISALETLPVRQNHVLIGNVTVAGEIRPVRATLQRIEAASTVGFKVAVVPASLKGNLVIDDYISKAIDVVYCDDVAQVLGLVLDAPKAEIKKLTGRLKPATTRVVATRKAASAVTA
jgi:predicted ATP-dependent serine protease